MTRPACALVAAGLYLLVLLPFLVTDYEHVHPHRRMYLLETRYISAADLVKDVLLNVAAFVPAGWLLHAAIREAVASPQARLLVVGGFCGLFSLAMETVQFFLPSRYSSGIDVLTDTGGAVLGALVAARWARRGRRQPEPGERGDGVEYDTRRVEASPMSHSDLILDQFTRQAVPFATAPSIKDEAALKLIVDWSGAGPDDTVLDVACGPGLVVCAFARVARHATGIDITPAMLERARTHAAERGLANVTWRQGDVLPLPWPDASFTVVTSRFAFHHFLEPGAVLREMARVCAPGGIVMVVDSAPAPDKADAFNRMEVVRDPSHARALPLAEHLRLFAQAGLPEPRVTHYRLEGELEALIARSFPRPGDDATLRRIFAESLVDDALGIQARRDGDTIRYGYPVAVMAARRG